MQPNGAMDYHYTLDLLHRINQLEVDGNPLIDTCLPTGENIWHAYQQRLFQECKIFSTGRWSPKKRRGFFSSFFGPCAYGVSLLALTKGMIIHPGILVFSEDKVSSKKYQGDKRIESLSIALEKTGASYIDYFHSTAREFFTHIKMRKRLALYREGILWRSTFFSPIARAIKKKEIVEKINQADFSLFTKEEQLFVRNCVERYLLEIDADIFLVSWLTKAMQKMRVKKGIGIDDTRFSGEFGLACKKAGVPSYAIQHGHFTRYHVGWLLPKNLRGIVMRPDHLIVWSGYWRDELLRLGTYFPPESFVIGGTPLSPIVSATKKDRTSFGILLPHEGDAPKEEVRVYVEKMLQDKNSIIYFKLRPNFSPASQYKEYGFSEGDKRIVPVSDVDAVFDRVDLVVGVYSTFLYDMIMKGKPVALLRTSMDYGEGMVRNGVAVPLELNSPTFFDDMRMASRQDVPALQSRLFDTTNSVEHLSRIIAPLMQS